MKIKAAVTHRPGGEFELEEVELGDPRPEEVLVRIVATGVCHTDMVARDQEYPVPLPAVLGHEGAGVVEKVGDNVTTVDVGDHVVLSFSSCGECKSCLTGHPYACENFFDLNFAGTSYYQDHRLQKNGQNLSTFFGQSSFGAYAVAHNRNVVKVDKDLDLSLLGPLGCGIQTGAGALLNTLKPQAGSTFAVFGCGAVGLSALLASKAVGVTTIIAVDVHDNRLELAHELGATHTVNAKNTDPVEKIKDITAGGVNYAVESSGVPAVLRQAVESLTFMGVTAVIGAPPFGKEVNLDINDILVTEKTVTGVIEGDSIPQIFIPQLIELYKAGKFPFDKLVKFYDFEEINAAVHDSETGKTIKPIVKISA